MVCVNSQQPAIIGSAVHAKLVPVANTVQPLHSMIETESSSSSDDFSPLPSSEHLPTSSHGHGFVNTVRTVAAHRLVSVNELDFENYTKLGQGSIARVFRAKLGNRTVAVKMLRTDLSQDEKAEQIAAKDLDRELKIVVCMPHHPNVIGFIAAGLGRSQEQTQQPVIVYEYMGAGSVQSVFQTKRAGSLAGKVWVPRQEQALRWCQQLYSALAFMHSLQTPLAHRDVKPDNLLMSADMQTVKLCDFSLATPLFARVQSYSNLPSIAGSMRYMAPEVAVNAPFSLEKTDIYSAAMTSFFLIHARKPFSALDADTAQRQAAAGHRPVVEDARIGTLLGVGWAVDPASRPRAAELAQKLEEMAASAGRKKPSLKKRILGKLGLK